MHSRSKMRLSVGLVKQRSQYHSLSLTYGEKIYLQDLRKGVPITFVSTSISRCQTDDFSQKPGFFA